MAVEVKFGDGSASIRVESRGENLEIGAVDPRAISETNELPKLTPEQAARARGSRTRRLGPRSRSDRSDVRRP